MFALYEHLATRLGLPNVMIGGTIGCKIRLAHETRKPTNEWIKNVTESDVMTIFIFSSLNSVLLVCYELVYQLKFLRFDEDQMSLYYRDRKSPLAQLKVCGDQVPTIERQMRTKKAHVEPFGICALGIRTYVNVLRTEMLLHMHPQDALAFLRRPKPKKQLYINVEYWDSVFNCHSRVESCCAIIFA